MEQHGQPQRQNARQMYRQPQAEANGSGQGQPSNSGSVERARQASYVQQSPGSGSSGRPGGDTQPVYGLPPGGQFQYPQYGSNIIYGMGQPQGPQTAQPSYDQMSQYRQRPAIGSETLGTQFGVPQYYLAGQPGPAGGTVPELVTQHLPSQYPQPDTYADAGPSAVHTYPASVMETPQTATYPSYTQQPQYTPQLQMPSDDQPFENYQAQIRNIFTLAHEGSLRDIGTQLLDISQYLLGNVETLGLTRDDETLHDGRIRLWDEFNRAWLVSLQKQLDLSQQVLQQNQPFGENQSIMDSQNLEHLSNELVRLCDNVEKHGLVDYQMGVAEEEIVELLLRCISVLNGRTHEGEGATTAPTAGSSRRR